MRTYITDGGWGVPLESRNSLKTKNGVGNIILNCLPFCALVSLLLLLPLFASSAPPRPAAPKAVGVNQTTPVAERTPVLVELFTAEGCSDCPPADALLARLEKTQPIPGAEVIALEQHVDYWDSQGWRDPFSSADATQRQKDYALHFGKGDPYTPQMVVDGTSGFVGSREAEARQAIARAAQNAKAPVELHWDTTDAQRTDTRAALEVRIGKLSDVAPHDSDEVFLVITEDGLHSNVARGENAGRALDHFCVVRHFERLGKADASGDPAFSARPVLKLKPAWKRPNLRAVVFVQQNRSRRVLAAASLPFANSQ